MATEETVVMDPQTMMQGAAQQAHPLTMYNETAISGAAPMALPTVFDFAPKSLTEAMELASMLAQSTMVPKDFRGNPGNCFLAMQWGAELRLKPLQAIQNIAVINGKPGIYGDVGKALLLAAGFQIFENDNRQIENQGYAECTIIAPNGARTTRSFSLNDAKTAKLWGKEGPWTQHPFRQMAWRAFWFAARDGAAHVLKGMAGVEELRDMERVVESEVAPIVTPAKPSRSDELAASLKKPTLAEVQKAFADATNDQQFEGAVAMAAKGGFTGDDKKSANNAYRDAHKRLHPPTQDAAPTAADVRTLLTKARDNNSLDDAKTALSMVDGIALDADVKAALKADCEAMVAQLTPK